MNRCLHDDARIRRINREDQNQLGVFSSVPIENFLKKNPDLMARLHQEHLVVIIIITFLW